MRNLAVGGIFAALMLLVADVQVNAAEKAATQQLPAAVAALGTSDSQVVSKEQAKGVRGDYMQLYVDGYVNMYGFQGQVYLNGYVNYVYLWVQPYYFGLVAY